MTESAKTGLNQQRFLACCAALLLAGGVATGGYFALHGFHCPGCGQGGEETQDATPAFGQAPVPYDKWERPLVALALTGQMHGYIDPCGCSDPQYGGLIRRYQFIQSLRDKKWDVVGLDLGELPALQGIRSQNLLKFDLTVKALAAMDYRAFGIGKNEILAGLGESLAQIYDDKRLLPRPLMLSLAQASKGQMFHELNVRGYEIISLPKPKLKIGVICMMGPDLRKELEAKQQFIENNVDALQKALKAFADAGVEIGIILHHEYPKIDESNLPKNMLAAQAIVEARKKKAQECAEFCANERKRNPKVPPIQLMMVLCDDGEAPAFLEQLPNLPTRIVEMGHKGKYVGLIGVYRQGKEYRFEHQNILMSGEWKPRKGQEDKNAVVKLMETYHDQLKKVDMLAQSPRTPHFNQLQQGNQPGMRATYVGSDRCADCHPHAFEVWKKTGHAKATTTLEDPKKDRRPLGRQYDPECMKCHVTGLKHPGGYNDLVINLGNWPAAPKQPPAANKVKRHNDNLRGVSCESCHGPGSEHVKNPDNKKLYALLNPFAPSKEERKLEAIAKRTPAQAKDLAEFTRLRLQNMNNLCISCHDGENDVRWGQPGHEIADNWAKLIHRTPRNAAPANPAVKGAGAPPPVIELIEDKK